MFQNWKGIGGPHRYFIHLTFSVFYEPLFLEHTILIAYCRIMYISCYVEKENSLRLYGGFCGKIMSLNISIWK